MGFVSTETISMAIHDASQQVMPPTNAACSKTLKMPTLVSHNMLAILVIWTICFVTQPQGLDGGITFLIPHHHPMLCAIVNPAQSDTGYFLEKTT